MELTYEQILKNATEAALQHSRELSRQGICAPLRLYFKVGALALQSEACTHDLAADGYKSTDRLLQPSVRYDAYSSWLRRNSQDLAILDWTGGAE